MAQKFEKFWISQAGIIIKNNKCLILEFTNKPGHWDIPGGRIDKGEADNSLESFRREIQEEIGIKDFDIIDLVDYDTWYVKKGRAKGRPMSAVAFLVEVKKIRSIKLSREHLQFKWITLNEVDDYKYIWPNTARMIKKGFKKYQELKSN